MNDIKEVATSTDNIWKILFDNKNWKDYTEQKQQELIDKISNNLIVHLTKYTDYMSNIKLPIKDMAV